MRALGCGKASSSPLFTKIPREDVCLNCLALSSLVQGFHGAVVVATIVNIVELSEVLSQRIAFGLTFSFLTRLP